MTTIYVFPGQGSQRVGMGVELFKFFPSETEIASQVLGYDIAELCEKDLRQELNRTNFTQPALFVVNALSYLKKVQVTLRKPDYVAGHSLGEYDALYASGVFDFETGLRLVQKRGELMSQASGGGMAAVIGLSQPRIQEVLAESGLTDIDIANLNAPQQIVISGPADRIRAAGPIFEKAGCRMFMPLKVSGAFHSRYMEAARAEFEKFIQSFEFFEPQMPVISNVAAQPYERAQVGRNLADQITNPVRWNESIQLLLSKPDPQFEEIGPGNVLTSLIRQIKSG